MKGWISILPAVLGFVTVIWAAPAAAANLEDQLAARWRDQWVVVKAPISSGCDGSYTNNPVAGRAVSGKGAVHLDAGEVARVHKVELKRSRIEVLIDLDEGLLRPYTDGPYRLFDDLSCKVELLIELPREVAKAKSLAEIEPVLGDLLDRFASRGEARAAPSWNRRRKEAFPEGYEQTVAEHRAWKARQVNAEIDRRIEEALTEAEYALRNASSDAEYAAGVGAGVEAMKWFSPSDCEGWLDATFSAASRYPPGETSSRFRDGFNAGQHLAYSLLLVSHLRECRMEP